VSAVKGGKGGLRARQRLRTVRYGLCALFLRTAYEKIEQALERIAHLPSAMAENPVKNPPEQGQLSRRRLA